MTKIIKLNLFCIFSLLCLLSFKQSVNTVVDTSSIVSGTSKITGRITGAKDTNTDSIIVNVYVSHPISGEEVQYKALVDREGKFSIDVDVETTITRVALYTNLNPEKNLLVKLTSGGVTNIDIAYNSDFDIENIDVRPNMNKNDITRGLEVVYKMIAHRSGRAPEHLYNKSTEYYLNYAKTILSERLTILDKDTLISKELKGVLSKDFRLFLYNTHVFPYKEEMIRNYKNTNVDKSKKPNIQKIGRSYFRFLKDFKLNDPQYLNCVTFPKVQKEILQNEILNLPVIGESDIPSWLASVKVILSDLVGFNDGQYYDILAANAYGRQLNEEVKPLTKKQKEHIVNYWKKGEIAKILFRKNQQVVELDKAKSPTVVNDVSLVPNDKVIATIVSKHSGKAVFIDLWATWCGPCLNAMQQFRSAKNDFRNKNVAFVYLTNSSSVNGVKRWEHHLRNVRSAESIVFHRKILAFFL